MTCRACGRPTRQRVRNGRRGHRLEWRTYCNGCDRLRRHGGLKRDVWIREFLSRMKSKRRCADCGGRCVRGRRRLGTSVVAAGKCSTSRTRTSSPRRRRWSRPALQANGRRSISGGCRACWRGGRDGSAGDRVSGCDSYSERDRDAGAFGAAHDEDALPGVYVSHILGAAGVILFYLAESGEASRLNTLMKADRLEREIAAIDGQRRPRRRQLIA